MGGIRGCLVEGEGGKHRRGGEDYREDSDGNWFVEIQPAESGMEPLPNYTLRLTSNLDTENALRTLMSNLTQVIVNGTTYLNLPSQPEESFSSSSKETPNKIVTIQVGGKEIQGICAKYAGCQCGCMNVFLKKTPAQNIVYVFQLQIKNQNNTNKHEELQQLKTEHEKILDGIDSKRLQRERLPSNCNQFGRDAY